MNIASQLAINPYGIQDNVGVIITDEPRCLFLEDFPTHEGKKYTFSMWVKGKGTVTVFGTAYNTTNDWVKVYGTTVDTDHPLVGFTAGTYYVYQAKMEQDSKYTDWVPYITEYDNDMAELLTEVNTTRSELKQTSDMLNAQVSSIYTDLNNTMTAVSDLKLTADGLDLTFSEYRTSANKNFTDIQGLLNQYSTYITFDVNGLKIGKTSSPFNSIFTESKLAFRQGTEEKAYITYEGLEVPDTAKVGKRLTLGNMYAFLMKDNGHLSLIKL